MHWLYHHYKTNVGIAAREWWDCYIYTSSTKPQQTFKDASATCSKSLMIHLGWSSNFLFFVFCFRSAPVPGGRMWFCGSWVLRSVLFGAARYLRLVLTAGNEADSKFPRPQNTTVSREAQKGFVHFGVRSLFSWLRAKPPTYLFKGNVLIRLVFLPELRSLTLRLTESSWRRPLVCEYSFGSLEIEFTVGAILWLRSTLKSKRLDFEMCGWYKRWARGRLSTSKCV